jgi:hypothetical protein
MKLTSDNLETLKLHFQILFKANVIPARKLVEGSKIIQDLLYFKKNNNTINYSCVLAWMAKSLLA